VTVSGANRSSCACGSAPGKVILFGEHAVVYGFPGIAFPLPACRARAEITGDCGDCGSGDCGSGGCSLTASDLQLSWSSGAGQQQIPPPLVPLWKVVELVRAERPDHPVRTAGGWSVTLCSGIPISRGLGSGAAVTVALLRAMDAFWQLGLTADDISRLTFEVEKLHHGRPSGIDNAVIAMERPVWFVRGRLPELLDLPPPDLVVADTGFRPPTSEVVAAVAALRERAPAVCDQTFARMGDIARAGRKALAAGDMTTVGQLMIENHRLLASLGASCPELETLISAALAAGALGAKLTGAGRGGCMIALVNNERDRSRICQALLRAGAARVITALPDCCRR